MTAENDIIADLSELEPAFTLSTPHERLTPFIFNSPHSGTHYPKAFLKASRLDPLILRKSEDAFVDELFSGVVGLGAPLLHAHFPRAYLDLNREPYELDPKLFPVGLPSYANCHSMRVAGGLGTIPRIITEGKIIYKKPPSLKAALLRIERLYKPYHQALRRLLDQSLELFGSAILIDCHSMPSHQTSPQKNSSLDFVLGDYHGTSCDERLTFFVAKKLQEMGYAVALNKPYAGGYITEHYGCPTSGISVLQIEINRKLYMDEARCQKKPSFADLQRNLETLTEQMMRDVPGKIGNQPLVAE